MIARLIWEVSVTVAVRYWLGLYAPLTEIPTWVAMLGLGLLMNPVPVSVRVAFVPGAAAGRLAGQIEVNRAVLAPGGVLIEPGVLGGRTLRSAKTLNVALVGALSRHVDFAEALWNQALRANLAPRLLELNLEAFAIGRNAGGAAASPA